MQNLSDIPVKQTIPGFFGKMVHGATSSLVFWDIKKGHTSPEHNHVHEQITYIVEGELEMVIGGEICCSPPVAFTSSPPSSATPPMR
jgi:uncharacterized cupin superfamily protein